MGNREDLLAGARQVILERGVAKATARDIAAAAGVSLAAIGYHFGSKDELVSAALAESLGSGIGDAIEEVVASTVEMPLLEGFQTLWERMPDILAANREALLASLENTVRIARDPHASKALADATEQAHLGMADIFRAARPDLDEADIEAIAKLDFLIVQSLGILWLISPEVIPTGEELARAVAAIASDGGQAISAE